MQPHDGSQNVTSSKVSEAVIRTLRHEVGDLLQTIYAAAAILNQRLPAGWEVERRVVADLRLRGEDCRKYLDFAQDLISPPPLGNDRLLVSESFAETIGKNTAKHPSVHVHQEIEPNLAIWCDAKKMGLVFHLLVSHAFESADKRVWIVVRKGNKPNSMEAALDYDIDRAIAHSAPNDSDPDLGIARLTHNARARLSLLLVEKLIRLHRGEIEVAPSNQAIYRIAFSLPGGTETSALAINKPIFDGATTSRGGRPA